MRTNQKRYGMGLASAVFILLAIAVIFGLLFDFFLTKVEYALYPKPEEFKSYVERYAKEYGVSENLIWAVIKTESSFNPSAESGKGAVGLMQLTSATFEEITTIRLKHGYDLGMRYDPKTNIQYGTYYLSYLYARYGDWDTALAAYNGGLGNVDDWLADPNLGNADGKTLKKIPYKETRNYVNKVNKALDKYESLYK